MYFIFGCIVHVLYRIIRYDTVFYIQVPFTFLAKYRCARQICKYVDSSYRILNNNIGNNKELGWNNTELVWDNTGILILLTTVKMYNTNPPKELDVLYTYYTKIRYNTKPVLYDADP